MLRSIKEFMVLLLTGLAILLTYLGGTCAYHYIDQNVPVVIEGTLLIHH